MLIDAYSGKVEGFGTKSREKPDGEWEEYQIAYVRGYVQGEVDGLYQVPLEEIVGRPKVGDWLSVFWDAAGPFWAPHPESVATGKD